MTDIESARAIVDRSYALLNERDVGNIPEVFTEDVVFDDDIWPDLIRGHAELERFLSSLWRAVPDSGSPSGPVHTSPRTARRLPSACRRAGRSAAPWTRRGMRRLGGR